MGPGSITSPRTGILTFLIILLAAGSALAYTGTIVLKSGDRLENISYSVNQTYKVIKYKVDGKDKAISFADIESLYDGSGQDVTEEILGGRYVQPKTQQQEQWLGAKDETYKRANAKPWHLGVRFGTNFTAPTSRYYEGLTSGVGFGADVIIPFSSTLALRGIVSMAGSRISENDFFNGSGYSVVENNLDVNVWRYLAAMQYQSPYARNRYDKGYWFLYSGLGATSHQFSGTALTQSMGDGQYYTFVATGGETKFTMTLGAGGVSMISKWGGIEYSGSVDWLFVGTATNTSGYKEAQYAANIDVHLGFIVVFPTHTNESTR